MDYDTASISGYRALVIGSSGTIGSAFTEYLTADPACSKVVTLSRTGHPGFDLEIPSRFREIVAELTPQGPYDLVVDATGTLALDDLGPEKALRSLDPVRLARYFQINAIGPVLLLRELEHALVRGRSVYVKLSARVGSISDNRLGGWYGYRASKAALNMLLQTAAIELKRSRPHIQVIAYQPGTVRSQFSAPFTNEDHPFIEAQHSVCGLMQRIWHIPDSSGARFMDFKGESIDW